MSISEFIYLNSKPVLIFITTLIHVLVWVSLTALFGLTGFLLSLLFTVGTLATVLENYYVATSPPFINEFTLYSIKVFIFFFIGTILYLFFA
jgi:hypothetical protein